MSNLSSLLKANTIAVIGASQQPQRAGSIVMHNLLSAGFKGVILPVTPKYKSVYGVLAYPDIHNLPLVPDLAIVCTNASRDPEIFTQLARLGVGAAVIISSDMYQKNQQGNSLDEECLAIAKQAGMRILGSNSLGIILPWLNINASLSPVTASKGSIAFISQSAAVCTTILDWANDKNIGFSAFISLGNSIDVDFAELLDSLSTDNKTRAILLYADSIKDARTFMSAARSASRNRRILVLKSGHSLAGQQAANIHTGALPSLDIVYDSAIKRSGMLRVHNTHELFAAVETLTHAVPLRGERLAIMTNGGGPAIMAVDALIERGGRLAQLSDATIQQLDQVLPTSWSRSNPINLVGDASSQRYIQALNILLDSDDIDAILIMHSPSAIAHSSQTAQGIIDTLHQHPKSKRFNILTNWSGEQTTREARSLFTQAGIPTYRTPEGAVGAYMHLVEYRRNQKQLMETPTSAQLRTNQQLEQALTWIGQQIDSHGSSANSHSSTQNKIKLDTHQVTRLFELYGFNVLPTRLASNVKQAVEMAQQLGYPVAIKLRSPDIEHKSEVQGVMLHLNNASEVSNAVEAILSRTSERYPDAQILGVSVQPMANRSGTQELRVRLTTDPIFGPVIMLGQGGADWDENIDASVALLPLNMALARYLIIRAIKVNRLRLEQQPNPVDTLALSEFLVRLSQMMIDCPAIHSLDIHPLLATGNEFTIVDAHLTLLDMDSPARQRLAIKPYPVEHEQWVELKNNSQTLLRPILPEDEHQLAQFIHRVSREDLYKRFFTDVGEFKHEALANLTQIDYDREMAFIATQKDEQQQEIIIGVVRVVADPQNYSAEFSILVRSDLKGIGLGRKLMEKIIAYSKLKGTRQITGMTMPTNKGMITLAKKLGFSADIHFGDNSVDMLLPLESTEKVTFQ